MVVFTSEEFEKHAFKSKDPIILDEEFLIEWNNKSCINDLGNNPLQWAVQWGYLNVVKYLVENGADITENVNWPLREAMRRNDIEIVKYILNTNIYDEKDIRYYSYSTIRHGMIDCDYQYDGSLFIPSSEVKELLLNYRQFSYTKACR